MKQYKYFFNVKKDAVFTEKQCQFCGTNENCLEGVYFEKEDVVSVCLTCLNKHKTNVEIPDYLSKCIHSNRDLKTKELMYTPPIPWVQFNDWQICCDDYMVYIGEWEQDDFINYCIDEDGISTLKKLLNNDTLSKVDDINVLWEDIGYNTVAYVFKCNVCGKITVVCQSF